MVSDKENDDNYQILIVKIIMRLRIKGTTTNLKFLFQNYSLKFGGKKSERRKMAAIKSTT